LRRRYQPPLWCKLKSVPKKKKSKKKSKKRALSKKKIAGVIAGTIIAGSSFWVLKSGKHQVIVPTYQSINVIDGDSFTTQENENIRLEAVDAPDKGLCGYEEAKKELTKLIKGKPLYIKTTFVDFNRRPVSYVYTTKGSVNANLVKSGWGRVKTKKDTESATMKKASEYAKKNNLGVYSSLCLSKEPEKPGCNIKGNISRGQGTKIYYFPGCSNYSLTLIEKDLGDRWFCTESQAKKAGFKRGGGCPDSVGGK